METDGLITVQDVLDVYLLRTEGKLSTNELAIVSIIESGLTHLSMFVLDNVSTKEMSVNHSLKTANYPSDLRKVIRIGVKQSNGHLYTLTRDDELTDVEYFSCDTSEADVSTSEIKLIYEGRRGGFSEYGSYKTDDKNRRLILSPNVNVDTLVFEYIGSGIKKAELTYIPATALEALVAYTKWQTSMSMPQSLRMEYKQEWNEAQEDLRRMTMPTMDELLDALAQGTTQMVTKA